MDPYSSERWILERHEAAVRAAERRARLVPGSAGSGALTTWVAGRLRVLADRLDGRGRFEGAAQ